MKHRFFLLVFIVLICTVILLDRVNPEFFMSEDISGGEITLSGTVIQPVKAKDNEFLFITDKGTLLIKVKGDPEESLLKMLEKGAAAVIELTPVKWESLTNFSQFDYGKYMKSKGIMYSASVYSDDITVTTEYPLSLRAFGSFVRSSFYETAGKYLDDDSAGILFAVVTGDTGNLSESDSELIRIGGLSHMTAVSGMHLAFYILPVKAFLKRKSLGIKARYLILVPFLLLFGAVADFSPSVSRALICCVVSCVAVFLAKPNDMLNTLGFSGTLQILLNPFVVFNTGFILSYMSICALYLTPDSFRKTAGRLLGKDQQEKGVFNLKNYAADSLISSLSILIVLWPVTSYLYGEISVLGLASVIPASPLSCLILLSGLLIIMAGLLNFQTVSAILSYAASAFCTVFRWVLSFMGWISTYGGVYSVFCPDVFFFVMYYGITGMIVFYRKNIKRFLVYALSFVLVCAGFSFGYKRKDRIYVFDVGQASGAAIITSEGKTVVIDTGDGSVELADMLRKYGCTQIDYLIISHGHEDHTGGFEELKENIKILNLIYPDNVYDTEAAKIAGEAEAAGINTVAVKEINFIALSPGTYLELYNYEDENLNEGSICVKYTRGRFVMYFTGDIESKTEKLLCSSGFLSDCDIMTAAHHGSNKSCSDDFLSAVTPENVIISVGEHNSYGHPSRDTLERIENHSAEIYRTDLCGAVKIEISVEGEYVICPKKS